MIDHCAYYDEGIEYPTIPTTPCHTISFHTIPYHIIPYHTIPHHTTPYHTIPYHTIPYHTIPYHTTPYHNHTKQLYNYILEISHVRAHTYIVYTSTHKHTPIHIHIYIYTYNFIDKQNAWLLWMLHCMPLCISKRLS